MGRIPLQSPQLKATSTGIRGDVQLGLPSPEPPNSNPGPNLSTDTARGRNKPRENQNHSTEKRLKQENLGKGFFLDLVLFGGFVWFAVSHGQCVRHSIFLFCSLSLSQALRFDLSEKWQLFFA